MALPKTGESIPSRNVPFTIDSSSGPQFIRAERQRRVQVESEVQNGSVRKMSLMSLMYMSSIVILFLCALSCMIALQRNTKLMEQNLALLDKQIQLSVRMTNKAKQRDFAILEMRGFDFNRMTSSRRTRRSAEVADACPPCPTEPPTPILPYKNPVSVLNEEVGSRAKYEVTHTCVDPPIHECTLRIEEDSAFTGKSWRGKGSSKQGAKQAAAWNAIKTDEYLKHLMELVGEEYKPPEFFNPICNKPNPPARF